MNVKAEYDKAIDEYGEKLIKQAAKVAKLINKFPLEYQCCALETALIAIMRDLDQSGHQATGALLGAIMKPFMVSMPPQVRIFDITEMMRKTRTSQSSRPDKTPRV